MSKKQILNTVLSVSILVALFALMNTITSFLWGSVLSVVIFTYIGVKIKELWNYFDNK